MKIYKVIFNATAYVKADSKEKAEKKLLNSFFGICFEEAEAEAEAFEIEEENDNE